MKETCFSCKFMRTINHPGGLWKGGREDDMTHEQVKNNYTKPSITYHCCFYPKHIEVDKNHWCGQYECDAIRIETLDSETE